MMKLAKGKKTGRPRVIDKEAVAKLEQAFSVGCTTREACLAAGISKDAYYRFLKRQPEFRDRFSQLMERPVLKARVRVVDAIDEGDTGTAKWYLERKRAKEFGATATLAVNVTHHEITEADVLARLSKFLSPEMMGHIADQDDNHDDSLVKQDRDLIEMIPASESILSAPTGFQPEK